jgi:uncharacterized membrane protein YagU involved in acid resistance
MVTTDPLPALNSIDTSWTYWVSRDKVNKLGPAVILQAIASGVLGRASFRMGVTAAALGLVLQWAMSLLIASIFVVAARRLTILARRWFVSGLAFGIVVFFVMNFVVVPLSAAGFTNKFTVATFFANLSAMLLFGLIIAFFGRVVAKG